jgi:DNA-formamidopyrimidine glycosylase
MRQRAIVDPCRGVTDHQVALGIGQIRSGWPGDVTGSHRPVDTDFRRPRADEAAETVLRVTCVMRRAMAGPVRHAAIMPEGHTIHRLAREHRTLFGGAVVCAESPQGRFAEGAATISGRVLSRVEPYGKHLLYRFDGLPERLHVHLGLYGKFVPGRLPAPEPRGALRLRLIGKESYADLRGPTACELMLPGDVKALLARLGPDPLKPRADPQRAWLKLSRSRTAVGALLMDQSVIAGVGNVYRAEVLYRARLSPFRMGRDVSAAQFAALWSDLVALMRLGVRDGRIVTTLPSDRPAGRQRRPQREDAHYVYRRTGEPCRICGTPIRTALMAARNLYWCPVCQK